MKALDTIRSLHFVWHLILRITAQINTLTLELEIWSRELRLIIPVHGGPSIVSVYLLVISSLEYHRVLELLLDLLGTTGAKYLERIDCA